MHVIDLRSIKCPMNFIRAKLEIERNEHLHNFKILLDDNESIDKVPLSLEEEGYVITAENLVKGHWELEIKKNKLNEKENEHRNFI